MKQKSAGLFNLRVLIRLSIVLASLFLGFIATAQEVWVARYKWAGECW